MNDWTYFNKNSVHLQLCQSVPHFQIWSRPQNKLCFYCFPGREWRAEHRQLSVLAASFHGSVAEGSRLWRYNGGHEEVKTLDFFSGLFWLAANFQMKHEVKTLWRCRFVLLPLILILLCGPSLQETRYPEGPGSGCSASFPSVGRRGENGHQQDRGVLGGESLPSQVTAPFICSSNPFSVPYCWRLACSSVSFHNDLGFLLFCFCWPEFLFDI